MIARVLVVALILLLTPRVARAERCGSEAVAWVARCAAATGVAMKLAECPSSVAIVEASSLRVEISTSQTAFRRVGAHGLSPIASFPDWKLEPEPIRNSFEALARCVEREAPDALVSRDASPPATAAPTRPLPPPFLVLVALTLVLFVVRPGARASALALASVVATVLVRRLLQPAAFFHQNGQGPEWIRFAVSGDAGPYGPGYPELFGWIASRSARPDLSVFFAQELLAATVPLAGYAIVRAVRGSRWVALVIGVALAIDPILTRTARSESYYAAITALLFAATAILLLGDRVRRRFIPAAIASGLLVAAAARVHPVAWLACAMVPLPLACRPGRLRDRWMQTAAATAVVALVALPFALPALRGAFHSGLGDGVRQARSVATRTLPAGAAALALLAVLTALPRTRPLGRHLLVLAVVAWAALASDLLAHNIAPVHASYLHLFLPAALASALAALALAPARVPAVVVVAALAAAHTYRERASVAMTTDNHELAWCLEWRETLPAGAEVVSLRRVGQRTLMLPLIGRDLPRWVPIDHVAAPHRASHYYRGSLCSTPEGAPVCAALEAGHHLRPIATRRFPSSPSASWLPLPPGDVEVTLFAVE